MRAFLFLCLHLLTQCANADTEILPEWPELSMDYKLQAGDIVFAQGSNSSKWDDYVFTVPESLDASCIYQKKPGILVNELNEQLKDRFNSENRTFRFFKVTTHTGVVHAHGMFNFPATYLIPPEGTMLTAVMLQCAGLTRISDDVVHVSRANVKEPTLIKVSVTALLEGEIEDVPIYNGDTITAFEREQ
ncbi:hypothetical protein [Cerasicoccus fimbriatus]|uniref:hypothetical protein n=1 Tax=Cerasicoccus fimbriatus TaxID=3014554 RepID=UPI0022B5DC7B|nr:hypothetical protein [Cerasicoccus sp. TK19100]